MDYAITDDGVVEDSRSLKVRTTQKLMFKSANFRPIFVDL